MTFETGDTLGINLPSSRSSQKQIRAEADSEPSAESVLFSHRRVPPSALTLCSFADNYMDLFHWGPLIRMLEILIASIISLWLVVSPFPSTQRPPKRFNNHQTQQQEEGAATGGRQGSIWNDCGSAAKDWNIKNVDVSVHFKNHCILLINGQLLRRGSSQNISTFSLTNTRKWIIWNYRTKLLMSHQRTASVKDYLDQSINSSVLLFQQKDYNWHLQYKTEKRKSFW